MYLNELLKEKNMSRYMLSKRSGVPQSTIADICSGKAKLEKCSIETVYKISKVLNVTMESWIESATRSNNIPQRSTFNVFKSNICHMLKSKGDVDFLIDMLSLDEVRTLYERGWYAECLYLLALIDYVSRLNNIPLCTNYDDIRQHKLKELVYPTGVIVMDQVMKTDKYQSDSLRNAIPEFLRFNIVECEVRDVC